jgi:putative redox protein
MSSDPPVVTQRHRFAGSTGAELAARLESPSKTPRAYALFAHCFTCTKDLKSEVWISRALVRAGIAVLRFDFTGIGESSGEFGETNFSSQVDDISAAARFLQERYRAPALLIGHSIGGTATLVAADDVPESKAVVTLASPSDTDHFKQSILRQAPDIHEKGEGEMEIAGQRFRLRKQLVEDLDRQHVQEHIRTLERALLVIHSRQDATVPIEHGERIFDTARHPKAFVSLQDADHLLLGNREDGPYVGRLIAAWAERYV